ncbi:MAG: translation initiation factor IF-2 [Chlamydiales bacterium]
MVKKKLNLNIKNQQLAKALDLNSLKGSLAKKKASEEDAEEKEDAKKDNIKAKDTSKVLESPEAKESEFVEKPQRKVRARSKSVFANEIKEAEPLPLSKPQEKIKISDDTNFENEEIKVTESTEQEPPPPEPAKTSPPELKEKEQQLGPTGKHISDLLPQKKAEEKIEKKVEKKEKRKTEDVDLKDVEIGREGFGAPKKGGKSFKFKEFRDFKPKKGQKSDANLIRQDEESVRFRRKRPKQKKFTEEIATVRPTELSIKTPITIKDLAAELKIKSSELISYLLSNGLMMTLNDVLEDETTIQLLGDEFGCQIKIDTSEEERIRITNKTIREEIEGTSEEKLQGRAPIVAFMGHVDHGKTSLIDAIRSTNIVSGESGAITQHIGAFRCKTDIGDITILDTPGHEAFSAMRARGANVTDIVVLVVAGDEGIKQQTIEAIQHARSAGVAIVVAINKSDKPNFNAENVYRQLAEQELLPEAWGGQTITINCSANTKEGINTLIEMLALQSEVMELRANPSGRARGSVLESHMHKGLGATATLLVLNGTLKIGDPLVLGSFWGRVKTMHDDHGNEINQSGPSVPVLITGISGIPEAGDEFIVVESDKEARLIAEARHQEARQRELLHKKAKSLESLIEKHSEANGKKILNILLRADVQGSVEALKTALLKIKSKKISLDIIFSGVGEITESDVQLAAASNAIILGFHTQVETHAEKAVKETGVRVMLHDVIYHAVDEVKESMVSALDKLPQENEKGKAEVRAIFKSSQHGVIAGCYIIEGTIMRSHRIRVLRGGKVIWTGAIQSIRREKEDVKEVNKGFECGILLNGFTDVEEGDILESFEIIYITQQL